MSSRANLLPLPAAPAGGAGSPPPATTQPRTFTLPAVDDATVMAMRPTNHVGQVLLGEGGEANIFDAIKKALAIQEIYQAVKGLDKPTPATRVVIGVTPGVHTIPDWTRALNPSTPEVERGRLPGFIDVIALEPTRDATTIQWGFSPSGGSHYWEGVNLTVPNTGVWEPKYPIHLSNAGTNIFTRVHFTSENNGAGGGSAMFGTDGDDGGCVVIHDAIFDGGTNQHGWDTITIPSTCVYSKVIAKSGLNFGDGPRTETQVWLVDSTAGDGFDIGGAYTHTHMSGCTGPLTRPYKDAQGQMQTGPAPTATLDDRRDWPVPVGGLSALDRQKWGMT